MKENLKLVLFSISKTIAFFVIVSVVFLIFLRVFNDLALFLNVFAIFLFVGWLAVTVWCLLAKSLKEYWLKMLGYVLSYILLLLFGMLPIGDVIFEGIVLLSWIAVGQNSAGDIHSYVNGVLTSALQYMVAAIFLAFMVALICVVMFFVALIRQRISRRKMCSEQLEETV